MEIEIVTTKKKLSKSIIKQFEDANWSTINYIVDPIKTDFYVVKDVYSYKILIFKISETWYKFPIHEYSLTAKGDDVYVNNNARLGIAGKASSSLFLSRMKQILHRSCKIFI
jgi:predicted phosphohydrolase